jgi:carbon storage regulator CsrA
MQNIQEVTSMLSLRRCEGESVTVGDDQVIIVQYFDGSQVVLGILSLRKIDEECTVTLRAKESMTIGDDITIHVRWGKDSSYVIMDFDAPRDIPIYRSEIYLDKIRRSEDAAESSGAT